jgi:hypothetical protein
MLPASGSRTLYEVASDIERINVRATRKLGWGVETTQVIPK